MKKRLLKILKSSVILLIAFSILGIIVGISEKEPEEDSETKFTKGQNEIPKRKKEKEDNQKIKENEQEQDKIVVQSEPFISEISGIFNQDVQNGLLYGDLEKLCITDGNGNLIQSYYDEGYMLTQGGTILSPNDIDTHLYKIEEGTNKIIFNTDLSSGYVNITHIAEDIIANNENIIGQKVAFCGLGNYHDSNRIELMYFEGEIGNAIVTAYYDSNKMPTIGDVEPLYMANTIVWGTVKGISVAHGVEIDLDAMNVSEQDLWFPEYHAYEYQEVDNASKASAADWGEKLSMEGTIQAENGKAHNLILDDGSLCELWGGMSEELSSVGGYAIYDSFNGVRVKVYGILASGKPLLYVDYIEPIIQ